jgi:hypothetical protein
MEYKKIYEIYKKYIKYMKYVKYIKTQVYVGKVTPQLKVE